MRSPASRGLRALRISFVEFGVRRCFTDVLSVEALAVSALGSTLGLLTLLALGVVDSPGWNEHAVRFAAGGAAGAWLLWCLLTAPLIQRDAALAALGAVDCPPTVRRSLVRLAKMGIAGNPRMPQADLMLLAYMKSPIGVRGQELILSLRERGIPHSANAVPQAIRTWHAFGLVHKGDVWFEWYWTGFGVEVGQALLTRRPADQLPITSPDHLSLEVPVPLAGE